MTEYQTVASEGAEIAYYVKGEGPLLMLIPGGNGYSSLYETMMAALADRYTVATYDRRANNKSTGDQNQDLDMAQAARDVAAVLRAIDRGPAYVFGNSAGANIALKLTQDHASLIRGLVDHEPPITDFLPQPAAGEWRHFFTSVEARFISEGAGAAMRLFASSMVGVDQTAMGAPGDQEGGNAERFLAHEFLHINSFVPDLEALRNSDVPMVTAIGRMSGGAFYAECARELARQLPCSCVEIVGNHLGYKIEPQAFADELDGILRNMPPRRFASA